MSNGYADRTHCNYGHEFSVENTGWRKDGGGRWCKTCKRERDSKRDRRNAELRRADPLIAELTRERDRLRKRRERSGGEELAHKNDEKRTAVHNVLGIKAQAIDSWKQMGEAMELLRTPCYVKPQDFIDFQDPRYPDDPEEQRGKPFPSTGQAEALCEGCPLMTPENVCLAYALKQKEDFGVWGGKRIVGGRVYRGQTRKEVAE